MKARLVLMLLALPGICMATVSALAQKDITNTTSVVKSSKKLLSPKAPLNVLIESLHSEDGNTRNRALSFIGSRGPEAKAAVPALIDNLENGLMVELTLHVIGKIGTNAVEAIPVLFKSITAYPRQPATRHCAAQALVNIGDAAVPTLKKGVGSDNIYERIWCHAALAKYEGAKSKHLQVFSDIMLSDDKRESAVALRALQMIGSDAKSLLPQIISALDKAQPEKKLLYTKKAELASLLACFGKDASPAIPQLVVLLDDSNPFICRSAARALSKIGGAETQTAVPGLNKMLSSKLPYVRETAVETLGEVGPTAVSSIYPIITLLKDENDHVRSKAAEALGKIAPTNTVVLQSLTEAMKDTSGRVRSSVAPILARNAPVTREMIDVFIAASDDNWKTVMWACETFFRRLEKDDRKLIPKRYGTDAGM